MNLREEAGMLADLAVDAARRGRTQAAVDYWGQAKKLYDADNAAWETLAHEFEGEIERLQVQLTTLVEQERIRALSHQQREYYA